MNFLEALSNKETQPQTKPDEAGLQAAMSQPDAGGDTSNSQGGFLNFIKFLLDPKNHTVELPMQGGASVNGHEAEQHIEND